MSCTLRFLRAGALIPLLAAFAGCLPVRLSIAPDGSAAVARDEGVFSVDPDAGKGTLVHRTKGEEKGVGAIWRQDGKRLLYVLRRGQRYRVLLRPWPGGEAATLLETGLPVAATSFSPDGRHVALILAPAGALPSLLLLQADGGREVARVSGIAPAHAWADAKSLWALRALRRDVAGTYQGQLVRIDVSGNVRPQARIVSGATCHLAYSRTRKTVAVVALGMGADPTKPATPADKRGDEGGRRRLFFYNRGKIESIKGARPHWVVFDRAGDRLLVDSGDARSALLLLDLRRRPLAPKTLATGIAARSARVGDATPFLPCFTPDGTKVCYWSYKANFGGGSRSLRAMRLELAGGGEARDLVPAIERAVSDALR